MLIRSIVSVIHDPDAHRHRPRADDASNSSSRSSGGSRFESSTPAIRAPGASTTAAATTGPASGPAPRLVDARRHA